MYIITINKLIIASNGCNIIIDENDEGTILKIKKVIKIFNI